MIYVTAPGVEKAISDICIELNQILLSPTFHMELSKYKDIFERSNIDGLTLSDEMVRVLTEKTITIDSYPSISKLDAFENNKIIINSHKLYERSAQSLAFIICSLTVSVVDSRTAYHFPYLTDGTNPSLGTPHEVVARIASEIFASNQAKKQILKGIRYGEETRKGHESAHHFVD